MDLRHHLATHLDKETVTPQSSVRSSDWGLNSVRFLGAVYHSVVNLEVSITSNGGRTNAAETPTSYWE